MRFKTADEAGLKIFCPARGGTDHPLSAQHGTKRNEIPEGRAEISELATIAARVGNCLRWDPPLFQQRVFTVSQCGWSGLKSPHEVTRIADFLSKEETYRRQYLKPENLFEHA